MSAALARPSETPAVNGADDEAADGEVFVAGAGDRSATNDIGLTAAAVRPDGTLGMPPTGVGVELGSFGGACLGGSGSLGASATGGGGGPAGD